MSSNLIVLIYFLSFTKICSCRNCPRITHMYNEAKVNTVLIFARKNGEVVLENASADNHSRFISTSAKPHMRRLMKAGKCGTSEKG